MERRAYDVEYDLAQLVDESDHVDPPPPVAAHLEQYTVEDISGLKIVLLKDSIRAACEAVDGDRTEKSERLAPHILEILTRDAIYPHLN